MRPSISPIASSSSPISPASSLVRFPPIFHRTPSLSFGYGYGYSESQISPLYSPTGSFRNRPASPIRRTSNRTPALDRHPEIEIEIELEPEPIVNSPDSFAESSNSSLNAEAFAKAQELENQYANLPPVDRGWRAWVFLLGAGMLEAFVWGWPYCIGLLRVYWAQELFPGGGNESIFSLAATLQSGLLYLGFGLIGPIYTAYPGYQRLIQGVGLIVSTTSIIASGFVTEPWHLILTSCLYGFSAALYFPVTALIFEWFHAKRGLAGGLLWASTGIGGCILPFVLQGLLKALGYRYTMVMLGLIYELGCGVAVIPIRRRIPLAMRKVEKVAEGTEKMDWGFLRSKAMIQGCVIVLITGMGIFIPTLWIPTFALDLKVAKPDGTALIAIMNAASIPGQALLGYMTDRLPLRLVVSICCLGASLSCFFLWGFATNPAILVFFSIIWGLTGLSSTGFWAKLIVNASGTDNRRTGIVCSIFFTLRGLGNLTCGPLSDALLSNKGLQKAIGGYGVKSYGSLILYTGLIWLASLLLFLPFGSGELPAAVVQEQLEEEKQAEQLAEERRGSTVARSINQSRHQSMEEKRASIAEKRVSVAKISTDPNVMRNQEELADVGANQNIGRGVET